LAIRDELLDELMKGYEKPEDLLGDGGLLKDLTKRLLEKALQGEMTHHLGYPKWWVISPCKAFSKSRFVKSLSNPPSPRRSSGFSYPFINSSNNSSRMANYLSSSS